MVRKRIAGYVFVTYKGDHRPYHVHVFSGSRELGRWDIENQVPMGRFELTDRLKKALIELGYATGERP
jgi:hypothetical protein